MFLDCLRFSSSPGHDSRTAYTALLFLFSCVLALFPRCLAVGEFASRWRLSLVVVLATYNRMKHLFLILSFSVTVADAGNLVVLSLQLLSLLPPAFTPFPLSLPSHKMAMLPEESLAASVISCPVKCLSDHPSEPRSNGTSCLVHERQLASQLASPRYRCP